MSLRGLETLFDRVHALLREIVPPGLYRALAGRYGKEEFLAAQEFVCQGAACLSELLERFRERVMRCEECSYDDICFLGRVVKELSYLDQFARLDMQWIPGFTLPQEQVKWCWPYPPHQDHHHGTRRTLKSWLGDALPREVEEERSFCGGLWEDFLQKLKPLLQVHLALRQQARGASAAMNSPLVERLLEEVEEALEEKEEGSGSAPKEREARGGARGNRVRGRISGFHENSEKMLGEFFIRSS